MTQKPGEYTTFELSPGIKPDQLFKPSAVIVAELDSLSGERLAERQRDLTMEVFLTAASFLIQSPVPEIREVAERTITSLREGTGMITGGETAHEIVTDLMQICRGVYNGPREFQLGESIFLSPIPHVTTPFGIRVETPVIGLPFAFTMDAPERPIQTLYGMLGTFSIYLDRVAGRLGPDPTSDDPELKLSLQRRDLLIVKLLKDLLSREVIAEEQLTPFMKEIMSSYPPSLGTKETDTDPGSEHREESTHMTLDIDSERRLHTIFEPKHRIVSRLRKSSDQFEAWGLTTAGMIRSYLKYLSTSKSPSVSRFAEIMQWRLSNMDIGIITGDDHTQMIFSQAEALNIAPPKDLAAKYEQAFEKWPALLPLPDYNLVFNIPVSRPMVGIPYKFILDGSVSPLITLCFMTQALSIARDRINGVLPNNYRVGDVNFERGYGLMSEILTWLIDEKAILKEGLSPHLLEILTEYPQGIDTVVAAAPQGLLYYTDAEREYLGL